MWLDGVDGGIRLFLEMTWVAAARATRCLAIHERSRRPCGQADRQLVYVVACGRRVRSGPPRLVLGTALLGSTATAAPRRRAASPRSSSRRGKRSRCVASRSCSGASARRTPTRRSAAGLVGLPTALQDVSARLQRATDKSARWPLSAGCALCSASGHVHAV